jgi:hypothetical protein
LGYGASLDRRGPPHFIRCGGRSSPAGSKGEKLGISAARLIGDVLRL